jgi:hypothetical protein
MGRGRAILSERIMKVSNKVLDLGNRMSMWVTAENELAIHVEKPDYPAIPFIRHMITPKHRDRIIEFLKTEWSKRADKIEGTHDNQRIKSDEGANHDRVNQLTESAES